MSSPTEHAWLEALAAIDDTVERERMAANSVLPPDAPAHVHVAVLSALYSDLRRASRLVDVGKAVAAVRTSPIFVAIMRPRWQPTRRLCACSTNRATIWNRRVPYRAACKR